MTGYDIYKKVCSMMGYAYDTDAAKEGRILRMTDIINRILSDLKAEGIASLSDPVILSAEKTEALLYGCAMMLAISESDSGTAAVFSEFYDVKRALALSDSASREDILPFPSRG